MPDSSSPFDDPFADLFGKLPSPRGRAGRSAGEEEEHGGVVQTPVTKTGGNATRSSQAIAPLSRRAAREAAGAVISSPAASPTSLPKARVPQGSRAAALSTPVPSAATTAGRETKAPTRPAATATLDELFTGRQSTDVLGDAPPPKNKRKRRIGGWIALAVVLVILGGIAAGGAWVWNTYENQIREVMGWEEPKDFEAGLATGEVLVTVVTGDTGNSISQTLFDQGVTKTSSAFYDYLIDTGQNPPFEPGVFAMQTQMTSAAALEAILDPASRRENSAQLREGLTLEQSLPLLAEGTGIPLEEFQAAVADPTLYGVSVDPAIVAAGGNPLEGWLFPATYTFNPGVTAQEVITTLVGRTVQSLDAAGVPVADRQHVLTIASIIQREARYEADMQKVSTVIVNRMKPDNQETFGLLQMDSTAQYGFGEEDGTASTSTEAQYDDNPWNTYVHTGLPVGPIANPGDVAIDAAMHPAEGNWMYFVTVNLDTGETAFTSNLADHNRAITQMVDWCRANPNAGC